MEYLIIVRMGKICKIQRYLRKG